MKHSWNGILFCSEESNGVVKRKAEADVSQRWTDKTLVYKIKKSDFSKSATFQYCHLWSWSRWNMFITRQKCPDTFNKKKDVLSIVFSLIILNNNWEKLIIFTGAAEQQVIMDAIADWKEYTCLKFREAKSSDINFVHIMDGAG